ncbi:MAG: sensor histidine kinase [Proteobacteria bacterium]|nr:sensor histidine kinase [Pseudomonadota bacterium]
MEPILQEWEDFARTIGPTTGVMDVVELRDHAEDMLKVIAADLATSQTDQESVEKSKGHATESSGDTAAEVHAEARLKSGFTIEQLISEYRALRASVLLLWSDQDDDVVRFHVRDITRFNEAVDQALAESVSRYAAMVRQAQDIFVGILGHDLRTPLQSVSLGAEYLMQSPDSDANLIQLGSRMFKSSTRMSEMLDNLLDFTRSRIGGGISISRAETNLAAVCEQVVEELSLSNPGRTIRCVIDGDVRGRWDAGRIGQVYQNLINNALQHGSKDGEVSVVTTAEPQEIVLTVHNDGEPIAPDEQEHIFDLLSRHARHAAGDGPSQKNLGLGLYITREIVLAHHGSISLQSTQAAGTTFTVRLPKDGT